MVQSIGNTVQWPLPVYNTPDIGVNDVRFKRILHQNSISDVQIFPGFANDGDYFLVETDFGTTDNYVKYYNSSMALQWTKNETDFQGSGHMTASAISGITLQGSELFVLVSNATTNSNGADYNLAKVVADGTVTNIGGTGVSNLRMGFMGAAGYISKPLGKSNFYVTCHQCSIEINASNGARVEGYTVNASALANPATFITSDNRSFSLAPRINNTSAYIYFNNFNSTFGLTGATTGITQQSNGIIRLDTVDGVPWQMTPFSVARQANQFFQFVDWGDYYILIQRSATTTSSGRTTFKGLWLKTRLDSWMKQWCDHFQIPVNNTFAS